MDQAQNSIQLKLVITYVCTLFCLHWLVKKEKQIFWKENSTRIEKLYTLEKKIFY